jgi:hypothetical protein
MIKKALTGTQFGLLHGLELASSISQKADLFCLLRGLTFWCVDMMRIAYAPPNQAISTLTYHSFSGRKRIRGKIRAIILQALTGPHFSICSLHCSVLTKCAIGFFAMVFATMLIEIVAAATE